MEKPTSKISIPILGDRACCSAFLHELRPISAEKAGSEQVHVQLGSNSAVFVPSVQLAPDQHGKSSGKRKVGSKTSQPQPTRSIPPSYGIAIVVHSTSLPSSGAAAVAAVSECCERGVPFLFVALPSPAAASELQQWAELINGMSMFAGLIYIVPANKELPEAPLESPESRSSESMPEEVQATAMPIEALVHYAVSLYLYPPHLLYDRFRCCLTPSGEAAVASLFCTFATTFGASACLSQADLRTFSTAIAAATAEKRNMMGKAVSALPLNLNVEDIMRVIGEIAADASPEAPAPEGVSAVPATSEVPISDEEGDAKSDHSSLSDCGSVDGATAPLIDNSDDKDQCLTLVGFQRLVSSLISIGHAESVWLLLLHNGIALPRDPLGVAERFSASKALVNALVSEAERIGRDTVRIGPSPAATEWLHQLWDNAAWRCNCWAMLPMGCPWRSHGGSWVPVFVPAQSSTSPGKRVTDSSVGLSTPAGTNSVELSPSPPPRDTVGAELSVRGDSSRQSQRSGRSCASSADICHSASALTFELFMRCWALHCLFVAPEDFAIAVAHWGYRGDAALCLYPKIPSADTFWLHRLVTCIVVGSPGCGKTTLLHRIAGFSVSDDTIYPSRKKNCSFSAAFGTIVPRTVLSTVNETANPVTSSTCIAFIECADDKKFLDNAALIRNADVALFLYDGSDAYSFSYLASRQLIAEKYAALPTLYAINKIDLPLVDQSCGKVTPDVFCSNKGLPWPPAQLCIPSDHPLSPIAQRRATSHAMSINSLLEIVHALSAEPSLSISIHSGIRQYSAAEKRRNRLLLLGAVSLVVGTVVWWRRRKSEKKN